MSDHVVAVTIAIGDKHAALGKMAAERMRHLTGLQVQILGSECLTLGQRPCDLKFRLFDLVAAENILYFDADVFCLRSWDPRELCDRPEWTAVRGWWFDPWVQRHGSVYGFGEDIFNGGMFFCNRTHHAEMLRLAGSLQGDGVFHGLANSDELALNPARTILGIPIRFLDRRFNWIQYGRGNLASYASVVLGHACDPDLRALYENSTATMVADSRSCSKCGEVSKELAGRTFIYDRHGYDRRPLYFRSDGTIGAGGGAAERFYFMTAHNNKRALVIGSELDETCILHKGPDGTWRGHWSHHERMPVSLTKHRAQVLIDLLRERFDGTHKLVGVEIGVHQGETSAILLRELPNLTLYLIDPWRMDGCHRWLSDADAMVSQRTFDDAMIQTACATAFAANRRASVRCTSAQAARALPDNMDFAFVDGDHSYDGVQADLGSWWPKLARGGLLCGHDYGNPNFPGVKRAVDEFAAGHGVSVRTDADMVWYLDGSAN